MMKRNERYITRYIAITSAFLGGRTYREGFSWETIVYSLVMGLVISLIFTALFDLLGIKTFNWLKRQFK